MLEIQRTYSRWLILSRCMKFHDHRLITESVLSHDLDLWPQLNRAGLIPRKSKTFHDHRWITWSVMVRKLFLIINAQWPWHFEVSWLLNVTINDISVIHVTAHKCAGGLKKLDPRSVSQRHRHFKRFFNVPVQVPTRGQTSYTILRKTAPFSRVLRQAMDTEDTFST